MNPARIAVRARASSASVGPLAMKRFSSSSMAASTRACGTPALTSAVMPNNPAISKPLSPALTVSAIRSR